MTWTSADGIRLASRVAGLNGEGALDVLARARALEARGRRVAHVEVGEPDFPTPPHIVEAGARALREGDTRYTPAAGLPELRATIAGTIEARGIPAVPDQIIVTPGVKPALFYSALAVIEPGDEVLLPDPGFPMYPSFTRFGGAVTVPYGLRPDDRRPDVDEIESLITPRTRVLFLNAPHNPTGGSVDAPTLERIAELVDRHDLIVITDEVYGRITYDDSHERAPSLAALPGVRDRVIVVDGFSKAYAMTGWRLGFAFVPLAMAERMAVLAVNGHTCTATVAQRAGIAALTGPQDAVRDMVAEFRRRREYIVGALNRIPGVTCPTPNGAFYAFPDLRAALSRTRTSIETFANRLLHEQGVAALAGTAFGPRGDGHLRISFAAGRETLEHAVQGIRACLEAL
jgi:aspartate/methionine/tyrosine aminotransferase